MPAATRADIDRILEAIRAEAKARGSKSRVGTYPVEPPSGPAPMPSTSSAFGLPLLEASHVCDFLAMPLDVFLCYAYRALLGRDPDPGGAAYYQRMLLRGRITRVEVMGRLAISGEGRQARLSIPGLMPAFLLATAYRIPVVGPIAGLIARLLRLPPHLLDRSTLEAAALASGAWMKR